MNNLCPCMLFTQEYEPEGANKAKHTGAQQVFTIGAFCYPMLGHLREKDTPYNPYKRSLYALMYSVFGA